MTAIIKYQANVIDAEIEGKRTRKSFDEVLVEVRLCERVDGKISLEVIRTIFPNRPSDERYIVRVNGNIDTEFPASKSGFGQAMKFFNGSRKIVFTTTTDVSVA